ncbi:multidrug resistance efflux transporter family protein [Methylobacter sp. S3L5C]|uniref:DMT family transporter n=1 Tax=Methylobacter sp. S3L5C TaxID=2839024 RepID=UPI001FABA535|nr:multidrug resistance efflux transporter family protein [Methylobacter sp. S3L5C]UOA09259.1 multidrug resistance efflux transporter family protein [Methylobacter sp. S3L5C]
MKNTTFVLMAIGLVSAFFFSSTFILNRTIAVEGGHWFWSASLRYSYMLLFLGLMIIVSNGFLYFKSLVSEFLKHYIFWVLSGSIGFGCFYALLCFAAATSPGWVVAATWQLTIVASLFVLTAFGKKIPKRTWLFALIILAGVSLVNLSQFEHSNTGQLLFNVLCIILAAFCYPLGNQLVWEAKNNRSGLPKISTTITNNAFAKVFLLSLGSFPLWIILFFCFDVSVPSEGQLINVAIVAILSGVFATPIFLYARNKANTPRKLAAVDASQSGEVIFALGGEVLFLGATYPNMLGFSGLFLIIIGLSAMIYFDNK